MNEKDFDDSLNSAISVNAENIMPNGSIADLQYSLTYNVHIPKPGEKIIVDAEIINEIEDECQRAKKVQFPFAELCLGVASLLIGAFISAILSQIAYGPNFLSIFFYTICPVIGVGSGVAYIFFRKKSIMDIKSFSEKIEEKLVRLKEEEMRED